MNALMSGFFVAEEAVGGVQEGDVDTKGGEDRGKLTADHARADDRERAEGFIHVNHMVAGHNELAIHLHAGEHPRS